MKQTDNNSSVYFLLDSASNAVKIGFTTSIRTRIQKLQAGNPNRLKLLAIVVGGKLRESFLHQKFAEYHIHGEWFRYEEPVIQFIKQYERRTTKQNHRLGLERDSQQSESRTATHQQDIQRMAA